MTETPSTLRGSDLTLLGGRVTALGDAWVELSDALATVRVAYAERPPLGLGEWVTLRAECANGEWVASAVIERQIPVRPWSTESARWTRADVLPKRARALAHIRAFLDARGYLEVDTPLRVPTPGLDAHVDALPSGEQYLIPSPELGMKRLLVRGLPRIYQLGHCFRADELGPLHRPEFTMLEWYRAFASMADMMHETETLVMSLARALEAPAVLRHREHQARLTLPFARMTVREAFARYATVEDAVDLATTDEDQFFQLLVDRVEPGLASLGRPVFLTHYPHSQASLARLCPHDPSVAERFELYACGVELCNGFGELTDAVLQRERFEAELALRARSGGRTYPVDEAFLAALETGMPPAAGNALGFDRLLMLLLGRDEIADVIADV